MNKYGYLITDKPNYRYLAFLGTVVSEPWCFHPAKHVGCRKLDSTYHKALKQSLELRYPSQ